MGDFDLSGALIVGQHLETGSAIHRLHPATKLFGTIVLMTGLVASGSIGGLILGFLLLLVLIRAARLPLGHCLKGIRSAAPLILFVSVLQILVIRRHDVGSILLDLGIVKITVTDLVVTATMALRFAGLIVLISLASSTTSSRDLTRGLDAALRPLARIGFPAHEFALTVTIALRFIPIIAQETSGLARAQASRGADFGRGRGGLFKRVRRMLPLLVPLFLTALRRAENLAVAMEARCYAGGSGRTQLIHFDSGPRDIVAVLVVCVVSAGLIAAGPLHWDVWLVHSVTG